MPSPVPLSVRSAIQLMLFALGAYLFALYLGLVVWTARDVASRTRDWLVRVLHVLLVAVFNLPGLVLYIVLRPRETLADAYARALEEEALLQDIENQSSCPSCRRRVAQDFAVCPYCRASLKSRCPSCDRLLNQSWEVCPYCGHEAGKPVKGTKERLAKLTAQPGQQDEATSPTS
jgi:RNA polymerase subunit RPABC4/transcription elongation factor Spt4